MSMLSNWSANTEPQLQGRLRRKGCGPVASNVGRQDTEMRRPMKIGFLHVVLVAALTTMHFAAAYDVQHPDKKLGSKKVTGRLLGYQEGDYAHAIVRTEKAGEQSFFVDDEICFLALNREEVLTIEYDEIQRFFPEGAGYFPANVIQAISTRAGERRWVRKMSAKPTAVEQKECSSVLRTTLFHRSGK